MNPLMIGILFIIFLGIVLYIMDYDERLKQRQEDFEQMMERAARGNTDPAN